MIKNFRSTFLMLFYAVLILIAGSTLGFSAGTPAGTVISNKVKITFDYGSQKGLEAFAESSLVVDNKVNPVVTSISSPSVLPGAKSQPLIFTVTNTGNAPQRYKLEAGPVYSPENIVFENIRIYLDKDESGTLTTGDIQYVDPESFGDIAPDKTIKILIIADVPDNVDNGKTSQYYLMATTVDAGTKNETKQTTGANTNAVDIVFADSKGVVDAEKDGKHSAMGVYTVKSAFVNIEKTLEIVSDPFGEGKPNKNAIVRYSLNITIIGDATAEKVLIKDAIPEGTDYVNGSIRLNGNALTDIEDEDAGYLKDNIVYVKLGDMTKNTPKQVISFEVKIK